MLVSGGASISFIMRSNSITGIKDEGAVCLLVLEENVISKADEAILRESLRDLLNVNRLIIALLSEAT